MLSKIKALQKITATKTFTNREKAQDSFHKAMRSYLANKKNFITLMFYGVGGIGKSTLLRHLQSEIDNHDEFQIVSIDLDASVFSSIASSLLAIRNQLSIPCYAFEYALARYWQVEGRSLDDIQRQIVNKDSILFDLVETASNISDVFAPAKLLYEIARKGNKAWHKWFGQEKLLLQQIDGFTEKELEEYLPYYLGLAIERAATQDNQHFVFFIDTHEKLLTYSNGDEWLRELIGSSENGLFVIAGREYLKWSDVDSEWSDFIEQHILGELTDIDAEYFLSKIPIDDKQIRKAIVSSAHGVPLYLDLCASIYTMKQQAGQSVSINDFQGAEKEVVKRFFSHLDREQSEALKIVSTLEQFDYLLFRELMKGMHIGFPSTLFREFCETSFASEINDRADVFKIHSIVQEFVQTEMDFNAHMIFEIVLSHCEKSLSNIDLERSSWIYQQAFLLLSKYNLKLREEEFNALIRIGLSLIDKGVWKEVEKALSLIDTTKVEFAKIRFLNALCLRKRGALSDANQLYKGILHLDLEPWTPMIRFHSAHVSHLLGNYDAAFEVYKQLMASHENTSIAKETKLLAIRQWADVLMLKGQFHDALETFNKLLVSQSIRHT